LAPVRRALARLVERVGVLGDHALPSARDRFLVERAAVAPDLRAEPQERRPGAAEDPLERLAPFAQRLVAVVGPPVAQDVEGDERNRGRAGGAGGAGGVEQVDAPLKILETGRLTLLVERHDFAVENDRLLARARPRGERAGDFGKLVRFLVPQARPQTDNSA